MRKFIKFFVIVFLLTPLISVKSLKDEDIDSQSTVCEYPELHNLELEYNENDPEAHLKNQDWLGEISEDEHIPFLSLIRYNQRSYSATDDINYPKDLYKEYQGKCPDKMWVCEVVTTTINITLAQGIITKIVRNFTDDDWKLFDFNHRTLYIMTDEEYKDSVVKEVIDSGGMKIVTEWDERWDNNGGNKDDFISKGWAFFGTLFQTLGDDVAPWGSGEEITVYSASCGSGDYDGPNKFNVNCLGLDSELIRYSKGIEEYKQCQDESCKIDVINYLNAKEDNLKSICKSYFAYYDVNDKQGPCLDECLQLKTILNDYRSGTDLYEDYSNLRDNCSMSQNIINMVYNILKWVKYIAPVLTIILSILDFIKALAAQSDDEMKKAQGKFVKRLIVSALLFLIPLIINFALKTFGFYHSGCDITDLFSGSK